MQTTGIKLQHSTRQSPNMFQICDLLATATHQDKHHLSPFDFRTVYIEQTLRNITAVNNNFKFNHYHTILISFADFFFLQPFYTNLYLIYLLQYHLHTFIHTQSFQNYSIISQRFWAGFAIRRIPQQPSAEVTSAIFHIHLQPY